MKKKLLVLMIAGMMSLSAVACGGTSDAQKTDSNAGEDASAEESSADVATADEPEPEDDGIINFDGEGYNVTYVKHETGTDYEGNPCLYYYYTFTNNGDENTSAAVASYIQCFQNGVQCQSAITSESNDSMDNYMMEVQPGGSVEVCQAFSLSDTSDVTIEASELISLDDSKDTQIISLE